MAQLMTMLLGPVLMAWGAQAAPSLTVVATPAAPQVGTAPTSLKFTFVGKDGTLMDFSGSYEIEISTTNNENIWNAGTITPQTLTYDGTALTGRTVTVTGKTLKITGGADITASTPAKPFVLEIATAALVAPQTQGQTVTFDLTLGGTKEVSNAAGWTVQAATVMSDPITFFNGVKTKFWIPLDTYTVLLETPDVKVLAKPLTGPGDLQWFESFKLLWSGEDTSADVRVVSGPESLVTQNGFVGEQIAANYSKSFHQVAPAPEMSFATADGRFLSVVRTEPHGFARTHGKYELESSCFQSPSITFCIYASHAGNEFPDDIEMQRKYVHLDLTITSSTMPLSSYTGVLPELWEVIPMSERVRNMTKSPTPPMAAPVCIGV